jgi:hypothetical protein
LIALAANAYWFPSQYAMMAMYFTYFRRQPWNKVAPQLALSPPYSSLSGWQRNVAAALAHKDPAESGHPGAPSSCGMRS